MVLPWFIMENIILYSKLATLLENLKSEVCDFIDFHSKDIKDENTPLSKPKFGSRKGIPK
jgi:hypothetical protein